MQGWLYSIHEASSRAWNAGGHVRSVAGTVGYIPGSYWREWVDNDERWEISVPSPQRPRPLRGHIKALGFAYRHDYIRELPGSFYVWSVCCCPFETSRNAELGMLGPGRRFCLRSRKMACVFWKERKGEREKREKKEEMFLCTPPTITQQHTLCLVVFMWYRQTTQRAMQGISPMHIT